MQIRHGLAVATNCFAKRTSASHRLLRCVWFCSESANPHCDAKKYWTIDVPTVDPYLKRQPGNVVGELQEILCEIGSHVYVNEEVAVIETDKVAVTVNAQREGVISAILAEIGDEVKECQPIYAVRDASIKLGYVARRWAREFSQRKARQEKDEEVERDRVLKMWRDRQEKQKQEEQRHEKTRQRHYESYSRNSWQRAIKAAFRKKAMQYHPDHNADAEAADKFKAVRDAYDKLTRS